MDLLEDTEKLGAKPVDTPIEQNDGLHSHSGELHRDKTSHQWLVGRLIYLTITKPDISYAVSFMHDPRTGHLNAVHRILKYLKESLEQGILYRSLGHIRAVACADAD